MTHRTVLFGIPGWEVARTATGWTAVRQGKLSDRQVRCCCLRQVTVRDFVSLELAVTAENIKASIIDVAEQLAARMAEADRQLRRHLDETRLVDPKQQP